MGENNYIEAYEHEFYNDELDGGHAHSWVVTGTPWEEFSFGKKYALIETKSLTYVRPHEAIDVTYCELCREWVESPMMVCEYRGRSGYVSVTSPGWPDRKPVKSNVHRLAEAIKALQYYANPPYVETDPTIAQEALKKIKEQDGE
jgi:hypothetical protein